MKTRIIIVDDYEHTRQWCRHILEESGRYEVIADFAGAANAELACMGKNVDMVLMDVCTEYGQSGLGSAAKIKKANPAVRLVIMTSMPEYSFVRRAKEIGCESFWYKESEEAGLIDVLDRTVMGESVYPSKMPVVTIGKACSDEFTIRELDVIRELVLGKSYMEIAKDLGISINTVKDHMKHIMAKTGYSKNLQIAVDVVEHRLILPDY